MNNRFFATLIVVCLAFAGGGCASEAQRQKYEDQALLPRQTGSLLNRRMNLEPDTSHKPKKKKHDETKAPAKKTAKKTEPTEPEKPKEPKPAQPEETPAEPDRFR